MRFWDSSAVVPLVVGQPASAEADGWFRDDPAISIWTLTPIEIASAIHRLHREGALDQRAVRSAEARIDELLRASHVVIDLDAAKAQARRALRLHALRAGDALQLGAAMAWAGGDPAGRVVHILDARLALAAQQEGFHVIPEPSPTS